MVHSGAYIRSNAQRLSRLPVIKACQRKRSDCMQTGRAPDKPGGLAKSSPEPFQSLAVTLCRDLHTLHADCVVGCQSATPAQKSSMAFCHRFIFANAAHSRPPGSTRPVGFAPRVRAGCIAGMLQGYGYVSFVYILGGLCAVASVCLVVAIVVALSIAGPKGAHKQSPAAGRRRPRADRITAQWPPRVNQPIR
jgi:hypothetical protein